MTSFDFINIIGTAAFTLAGYLVGVRKRLDMLGVLICALLTATGGGMVRDVLVGRTPMIFVEYAPLAVIAVTLAAAYLFKLQHTQKKVLAQAFVWADSLGLVAFTLIGAQVGKSGCFTI
ncbi:trimeric intracellular cation channel family protein [Bergeriella denitrificans]|uniref:Predicted membrane protein n=1 Tax=Bergeriella denitrificans TaxID=494 RepID=A0A378UI70_BERDE|nr:TRIC cation channel family protein [Bergeriella denitrificans]STZ77026.1 Predicted membrane protein [Bergeriella denitrificans]